MSAKIQMLDCTLRDGAYIVDAKFGTPAIKGIIKKMQDANVDIIECGWLKDSPHQEGTTFYHVPADMKQYMTGKSDHATYVAMIDWDRYDLSQLPQNDGTSIDAIRVVFPQAKFREGIALGKIIEEKGYQVFFQAANTLGYSDEELVALAEEVNKARPVSISVVDTFGAMYEKDLRHILTVLDKHLDPEIKIGFHAHNNQQLAFANTMTFVEFLQEKGRDIIVDATLCGMGRGAGNATTELVANYLNQQWQCNFDMNVIMDAIDLYMEYFQNNFTWGYSTSYFIAGMYCTHVNNIAYLLNNHRTNAKDMRNIIESLSPEDRKKYDYDLLEQKFVDYQNKIVDDEQALADLKSAIGDREVLLVFPGTSTVKEKDKILVYINEKKPVVIGINAVIEGYTYDYLFFSNKLRYDYAGEIHTDVFNGCKRIVASSVKTAGDAGEFVVNYNLLVKRGWEHFDNAGIMCMRLLNKLHVTHVSLAGFDGFGDDYDDSYADRSLPHINPGKEWDALNDEIKDMFRDFKETTADYMTINFLTASKFA